MSADSAGSGRILAVESSCDETAVAVVDTGRRIVANVVASQVALHSTTGGIVPEVAARAHLRWMIPVLEEALQRAGIADASRVDAIAVTEGPGLAGSLLVGITMAKTLGFLHHRPVVPVNHLEGHIYAAWLLHPAEDESPPPAFPLVALVVSGGHTFLVEMDDHLRYRLLGQTVDDAAGEAFDKVARLLGLPFPGGPHIDRLAQQAQVTIDFPRGLSSGRDLERHRFDYSFSGLKTAVARWVEAREQAGQVVPVAEVAASFQEAVCDILTRKAIDACRQTGARHLVIGGGVAANSRLRALAEERAAAHDIAVRV
ncbi:MAG TPA: tRNA (adenosine(37)-N6)-threonylcarbamoyltransferase complex transferase subunit TsaD, partial [Candidatus Limnocylindrales bacterium]|nr:tRNA (adenosine(37)-N6)-threonylcarbamoyltransferase complex transferase subunit TsaD [Candidatus Limnocylindrales bacterium]